MPGLKKNVSRKKSARKQDPAGALRRHLVKLLDGGEAHVTVALALADFPAGKRGAFAGGLEHTGWQLLEHMRIAQWDLLEFSRNPRHASPEFPDGYWPLRPAPQDDRAWAKSVRALLRDLREMKRLLADPRADLFAPFPWGNGQTLLREALVLGDHTAYHLGQ